MKKVSPVPAHTTLCAEGADRLSRLAVEHRAPVHTAVLGLPNPARRGANVRDERVPGLAHDGDGAVPFGSDEAVMQPRPQRRIHLLRGGTAKGRGGKQERESNSSHDPSQCSLFHLTSMRTVAGATPPPSASAVRVAVPGRPFDRMITTALPLKSRTCFA